MTKGLAVVIATIAIEIGLTMLYAAIDGATTGVKAVEMAQRTKSRTEVTLRPTVSYSIPMTRTPGPIRQFA